MLIRKIFFKSSIKLFLFIGLESDFRTRRHFEIAQVIFAKPTFNDHFKVQVCAAIGEWEQHELGLNKFLNSHIMK